MTSTQSMFDACRASARSCARRSTVAFSLASLAMAMIVSMAGCRTSSPPPLEPPQVLRAPYGTEGNEVLWAVAPIRNESGTTTADAGVMSDKLVAAIAETRGVRCLPLNRTIEAMRALEMTAVRSPSDALALAKAMGADGIVVGSMTAYDPYQPTLGLTVALYGRPGAMTPTTLEAGVNPRELTARPNEPTGGAAGNFSQKPLSVASEHLDGKNHQVLLDVQAYATGRSDRASALGWKRYTASMDLYMEFASNFVVGRLIQNEWIRLAKVPPREEPK
jgi:hypothetical protein